MERDKESYYIKGYKHELIKAKYFQKRLFFHDD